MDPRRIVASALSGVTLALFVASLAVTFPKAPPPPDPRHVPELWAAGDPGDTLSRGAALSVLLAQHGLDDHQTREIIRLLRTYKSPRSLQPGVAVRFYPRGGAPTKIRLDLNSD